MNVKLVSVTPDAEKTMAYIARVSNPSNQDNENYSGLLKYCIKHNHWSVFEQSTMTLEIETTRAIAAQILRHRSFTFQEFSQRYADAKLLETIELPELRRQDSKNRQNSIDDLDPVIVDKLEKQMCNGVRWRAAMDLMATESDLHIVEIGPSNVLSGLVKRHLKDVKISQVSSSNQISY